jgi:hypothetical protein
VQNSAHRPRRYPRARPDIRFVSVGGTLALGSAGGLSHPVDFTHALVLTFCDGRHDTRSIARAVAGSFAGDDRNDAVQASVEQIIDTFDRDGLLL